MSVHLRVDLRSKDGKKLKPMSEKQRWERLTEEDKFSETAGKIPLALLIYSLEITIIAFILIFLGQVSGVLKQEIIPASMINSILGFFSTQNYEAMKETKNLNASTVAKAGRNLLMGAKN